MADELRAAFVVGSRCWGVVSLLRATDDGPFTDEECRHIESLVPMIANALRAAVVALDVESRGSASMLVVDADNQVQDLTIEAAGMLDDLRTVGVDEEGLPAIVRSVVTRARASRSSTNVATRVHGTSGVWRRVTAIPMEDDPGRVVNRHRMVPDLNGSGTLRAHRRGSGTVWAGCCRALLLRGRSAWTSGSMD